MKRGSDIQGLEKTTRQIVNVKPETIKSRKTDANTAAASSVLLLQMVFSQILDACAPHWIYADGDRQHRPMSMLHPHYKS